MAKQQYAPIPEAVLNRMSDEEQTQLYLQVLHEGEETVALFVKDPVERIMVRGRALYQSVREKANKNVYVAINPVFPGSTSKHKCNFVGRKVFYADVDIHEKEIDAEELDAKLQKCRETFFQAIKEGTFPVPTMIDSTGRGLHIYIVFETVYADIAEDSQDFEAYYQKTRQIFKEFSVDIDHTVGDLPRVSRVPGTINTKSGRKCRMIFFSGLTYTREEFRDLFEVQLLPSPKPSKSREKSKSEKKTKQPENASRRNKKNSEDDRLVGADYDKHHPTHEHLMKTWHLRHVEAIVLYRIEHDDKRVFRKRFTHVLYNVALEIMSPHKAFQYVSKINAKYETPLGEGDLLAQCNAGPNGEPIPQSNENVARLWEITEEEKRKFNWDAFNNKEQRLEERRQQDEKRRRRIVQMKQEGLSYRAIEKRLEQEGYEPIKKSRIQKIYEELTHGGELRYEDIDFEEHKLYARAKEKCPQIPISEEREEEEGGSIQSPPPIPLSSQIGRLEDPNLNRIMQAIREGKDIHLLGPGGTGKSTIIKKLIVRLTEMHPRNYRIERAAFTGSAAANIGGKTLHALLGLKVGEIIRPEDILLSKYATKNVRIIWVDEIGLVPRQIMEALYSMRDKMEAKYHHTVILIFSGDFCQIAPFIPKEESEIYASILTDPIVSGYAFECRQWRERPCDKIFLAKNYRAGEDPAFAETLQLMHDGKVVAFDQVMRMIQPGAAWDVLSQPNSAYICATREQVDRYNNETVERFSGYTRSYQAYYDAGIHTIRLGKGMPVMTTINAKNRSYQNGTRGVVKRMTDDFIVLKVKETDVFVHKDYHHGNAFPIRLAYAITVNRAQGLEFDKINIVGGYFEAGQLYTAFSRAHKSSDIRLVTPIQREEYLTNMAAVREMHPELQQEETA
ncbi:MAG: AAA family ATPase [Lachnospiraceae bacterium]|nr:AAA family ATPase [Lachnospiraceae bacterium]